MLPYKQQLFGSDPQAGVPRVGGGDSGFVQSSLSVDRATPTVPTRGVQSTTAFGSPARTAKMSLAHRKLVGDVRFRAFHSEQTRECQSTARRRLENEGRTAGIVSIENGLGLQLHQV